MLSKEALAALEVILIREKATALSERQGAQRMWGAYGDRRPVLGDRLAMATDRYEIADSLLTLVRSELNAR